MAMGHRRKVGDNLGQAELFKKGKWRSAMDTNGKRKKSEKVRGTIMCTDETPSLTTSGRKEQPTIVESSKAATRAIESCCGHIRVLIIRKKNKNEHRKLHLAQLVQAEAQHIEKRLAGGVEHAMAAEVDLGHAVLPHVPGAGEIEVGYKGV
jgi:hypothetical protein